MILVIVDIEPKLSHNKLQKKLFLLREFASKKAKKLSRQTLRTGGQKKLDSYSISAG